MLDSLMPFDKFNGVLVLKNNMRSVSALKV
jgi:hypothetical protein